MCCGTRSTCDCSTHPNNHRLSTIAMCNGAKINLRCEPFQGSTCRGYGIGQERITQDFVAEACRWVVGGADDASHASSSDTRTFDNGHALWKGCANDDHRQCDCAVHWSSCAVGVLMYSECVLCAIDEIDFWYGHVSDCAVQRWCDTWQCLPA